MWPWASLRGSCLHLRPFILSIEGLLQDIGQSLWEVIWRATKELGLFGGGPQNSVNIWTWKARFSSSLAGKMSKERKNCACKASSAFCGDICCRKIDTPVGRWGDFSKALLFVCLCEWGALSILRACVRKQKLHVIKE